MSLTEGFPIRTLGDGMEKLPSNVAEVLRITSSTNILKSMKPVEPASKVINLVPKFIPQDKKIPNLMSSKPREPRFVPYEPYKAAVQPMKVLKTKRKRITEISVESKPSKNNVEIQELVHQMSEMRMREIDKLQLTTLNEDDLISRQLWQKEKDAYETDIKNLKETKAHLENQLKFQAQVNSELKTLLVAAVGEDLESRVQHLTEDKLSLARALLNSANHLTSHQEQTEWLSGQCEVWRSKFLASSLMVEELARWKSALTNKINDLQKVITSILSDHYKLQKEMVTTFSILNGVSKTLNSNKRYNLKAGDIMELGFNIKNLSEEIADIIVVDSKLKVFDVKLLNAYSPTEKLALKVLKHSVSLTSPQDALCNALVGAAHSMSGDQRFVSNQFLHPCCSHCIGKPQDI